MGKPGLSLTHGFQASDSNECRLRRISDQRREADLDSLATASNKWRALGFQSQGHRWSEFGDLYVFTRNHHQDHRHR